MATDPNIDQPLREAHDNFLDALVAAGTAANEPGYDTFLPALREAIERACDLQHEVKKLLDQTGSIRLTSVGESRKPFLGFGGGDDAR